MTELTNPQIRELKAKAQRLKPMLKVGKDGLSPGFLTALDEALKHNPLLKVKFDAFKEEKRQMAQTMAQRAGAHLVTRVGNVIVLYRPKPESQDR